jgi:multiple antibiotic resistance protein
MLGQLSTWKSRLGSSAPGTSADRPTGSSINALAVYPLAVPAIAGPGAMLTTVLLTDNRLYGFWDQSLTTAVLAVVLSIYFVILLFANPIMKLIGIGGANVLRRVMGILLSAIAIKMVLTAFQAWLGLPEL